MKRMKSHAKHMTINVLNGEKPGQALICDKLAKFRDLNATNKRMGT